MPVYQLHSDSVLFPPPEEAERSGLLAIGGDLSSERLLAAYHLGIFPWYEQGQPILWWSPDPRLVLFPQELKISRSLRKTLCKQKFETRIDTNFEEVIEQCGTLRQESGTWITPQMKQSYTQLFVEGFAHSFESWQHGELVGGLYGISLGRCFFGESMFSKSSDASKVALVALVNFALAHEIQLIDCQVTTSHLLRMGACEISRYEFLHQLQKELQYPNLRGRWIVQ